MVHSGWVQTIYIVGMGRWLGTLRRASRFTTNLPYKLTFNYPVDKPTQEEEEEEEEEDDDDDDDDDDKKQYRPNISTLVVKKVYKR